MYKDNEAKNIILMFGCKMMQDLKQSCTLALFDLLGRKRKNEKQKTITLPESLLFIDNAKQDEIVETVDLEEEERQALL